MQTNYRNVRRRTLTWGIASLTAAALIGAALPVFAGEPLYGWAPLSTRPLHPTYAAPPTKAVYPQPVVTIAPQPTPYPYGYFGAVGRHSSVQAGPGSLPGSRSWSYGFRR